MSLRETTCGSFRSSADFSAGHRDFDINPARSASLVFVKEGFKFAHFAAFQAGDVDVVARAVAFVEVLVAAEVQQVELIDEAVTFQQTRVR